MGDKVHGSVTGKGHPVVLELTPGQAGDAPHAADLLAGQERGRVRSGSERVTPHPLCPGSRHLEPRKTGRFRPPPTAAVLHPKCGRARLVAALAGRSLRHSRHPDPAGPARPIRRS